MAMINGDTEQALGITANAKREAKKIKEMLVEAGVTDFSNLKELANVEGRLDDELRSMIKSFKVKYCLELEACME